MDDQSDGRSKQRRTVSFTHGQVGVGGAIIAAIMTINPIKEWFFTREEGTAQRQSIELLRGEVVSMRDELSRRQERNTDKILEYIKSAEERTVRNEDRMERRIDTLEAYNKFKSEKKSNN